MKKQTDRGIKYCECLDFVEASHRHRVYPLLYCHIKFAGHLNIDRLKQAVALSGEIVPEILFGYNFQKGCFIPLGYTVDDVVMEHVTEPTPLLRPDLSKHPQLKIVITPHQQYDQVIVVMSHILADGEGFLQYLYLLAAFYNDEQADGNRKNERNLTPFLENIRVLAPTQQTRHNRHLSVPPLRSFGKGNYLFCLKTQIPAESMRSIHQKAKQFGVTLNDVFMTAYVRVIARLQNISTVVIPCPADLRRFSPQVQKLTVANMTGVYREIAVEMEHNCTFDATLKQVHIEMSLQKSRYRCFAGIRALHKTFHRIPCSILEKIIKVIYPLYPVSYTNIGVIDDTKLYFKDCTIQSCFFTGTYRLPPDFQLTVSTFKNVCTLNCTLCGSLDNTKNGQYILEQVKSELLEWVENN